MTVLRNNFDGGPDGTTIAVSNSGQYNNDAFNVVYDTGISGVVFRFKDASTLVRPTAEYVLELATGSTIANPAVEWNTAMGTKAEVWTRFYVRFSSIVSSARDLNLCVIGNTTANKYVALWAETTHSPISLAIQNLNSGLITYASTALTSDEWHRIEFHVVMDTSAGLSDLKYYSGNNVDTDILTDSVSQTSQNYGATTANVYALGPWWSHQLNTPSTYFSNWTLNDTGWPGPEPFRCGKGVPGILTNPIAIHSGAR